MIQQAKIIDLNAYRAKISVVSNTYTVSAENSDSQLERHLVADFAQKMQTTFKRAPIQAELAQLLDHLEVLSNF